MLAQKLQKFLTDDSGASAIEYSMTVALIAMVAVGSFIFTGGEVEELWNKVVAGSLALAQF